MLDELVDLDEERLTALDVLLRQKERVAKAYNKKVKSKSFNVGDLVWKVLLPMEKKDKVLGIWSPNWEGSFEVIHVFSNGAYEIEELASDIIFEKIQTCVAGSQNNTRVVPARNGKLGIMIELK